MMEGRGFGFVTYKDPTSAQRFLEVWPSSSDGAPVGWMRLFDDQVFVKMKLYERP